MRDPREGVVVCKKIAVRKDRSIDLAQKSRGSGGHHTFHGAWGSLVREKGERGRGANETAKEARAHVAPQQMAVWPREGRMLVARKKKLVFVERQPLKRE